MKWNYVPFGAGAEYAISKCKQKKNNYFLRNCQCSKIVDRVYLKIIIEK